MFCQNDRTGITASQLILFACIVLGSILMQWSDIVGNMIVMATVCMVCMICINFDFLHPLTWYSIGFTLYAIGYPLYCAVRGTLYLCSDRLVSIEWVGFAVILLILIPTVKDKKERVLLKCSEEKVNIKRAMVIVISICAFITLLTVYFVGRGLLSKAKIRGTDGVLSVLYYYAGYLLLLTYVYLLNILLRSRTNNNKKARRRLTLLVLMTSFAILLIAGTGERDFLFRFLGVTLLSLYSAKVVKKTHILLILPLFVFAIAASISLKYALYTGDIARNNRSLLENFLRADFISAGSNLQIILDNNLASTGSFLTLLSETVQPTQSIYLAQIIGHTTSGLGFTIIGFGYMAMGVLGIAITMIAIGLLLKYVYRKSDENLLALTLYLCLIPDFIYTSRSSLYSIIKPISYYFPALVILRLAIKSGFLVLVKSDEMYVHKYESRVSS